MTSQVIVNVESRLKSQAMKKARDQGMPFSSVLNLAIRAFVEGRLNVGLVGNLNHSTSNEVSKAIKDIAKGKNMSPRLSSIAQVRAYLDN